MADALENPAAVDECVEEDDDETSPRSCSASLCCCFPAIALRLAAREGTARRHLLQRQREVAEENWVVRCAKKAKEISEVVAGPKWKNFIRRFSRKKMRTQFHYDPESYALNFDDGVDRTTPELDFLSAKADFDRT